MSCTAPRPPLVLYRTLVFESRINERFPKCWNQEHSWGIPPKYSHSFKFVTADHIQPGFMGCISAVGGLDDTALPFRSPSERTLTPSMAFFILVPLSSL